MKLVISNLNPETSIQTIKGLLNYYGSVLDVELLKNKRGRFEGVAFVKMSESTVLERLVEKLDGLLLDGKMIVVEVEEG